ncbi:MAG TPA: hypothetical protein VKX31_02550 [Brumimicrobium sp.]|nr:hypothetical protein [Brumimicrobium sp.]
MKLKYFFPIIAVGLLFSCKKDEIEPTPEEDQGPRIIFRMKLDSNQERLDNFGLPSTVPANHSTQTPSFNGIALHYIELSPSAYTPIGDGEIFYIEPSTTQGGVKAIHFDKLNVVQSGEIAHSVPLSKVAPGQYTYVRAAVAYQNFDVEFRAAGFDLEGTLASFVGYNNYISSYKVKDKTVQINGNKVQGYWAFETQAIPPYYAGEVIEGQAPLTSVPNPLHSTSPIPPGSCTLTGAFAEVFEITGEETEDIIIDLSYSINESFEWKDANQNGIYEPLDGDTVVDMGLRGLIPIVVE